jgi:hypothetical protein
MLGLLFIPEVAQSQEATVITGPGQIGCTNLFQLPSGPQVTSGQVSVLVPDWHALGDSTTVQNALNKGQEAAYAWCMRTVTPDRLPPVMVVHIRAQNSPFDIVDAWWYRADGQWRIGQNMFAQLTSQENQRIANQHQQEEAAKQAQLAAQAKEKIKQTALADCGPSPTISGGPWFSSTYKVAAVDAARADGMLCTKTVEYVGAAVNPFGGNAARAKFTGYDPINFQPVTVMRDFPY